MIQSTCKMEEGVSKKFFYGPFLTIFQALGLIPFRKSNLDIFELYSPLRVHSAVCFSILIHCRIEYCNIFTFSNFDQIFTFVFVTLHSVGTHVVLLVEYFFLFMENKRLCSMAVNIVILKSRFHNADKNEQRSIAKPIIGLICTHAVLYIYTIIANAGSAYALAVGRCTWFFSMFNIYSLMMDSVIMFYLGNLKLLLSKINMTLLEIRRHTNDRIKMSKIKRLRFLHYFTSDEVNKFNKIFGKVILISSFKEFVIFVDTPFYALTKPSKILTYQDFFVWFARYFTSFLTKLILFHLTCKKVSYFSKHFINRLTLDQK